MVGIDEVRDPAAALEAVVPHQLQPRDGVHHRIARALHPDHGVDHPFALFARNHQVVGIGERCVEVDRNALDGGIPLHVFDRLGHMLPVVLVHHHIDVQMRMAAGGDVALQTRERAFAADHFVVLPAAVEADPDAVGMAPGEGQLCVGGDRHGEETHLAGQVDHVVDPLVAVAPDHHLAPLQIDEARTEAVGVFQLAADLLEGHLVGRSPRIDRAVPATEVASVRDEQHGLQRPFAAENPGSEEPPAEIEQPFDFLHNHSIISSTV